VLSRPGNCSAAGLGVYHPGMVTTSVATAWVFSQDLWFFDLALGYGFFTKTLGCLWGF